MFRALTSKKKHILKTENFEFWWLVVKKFKKRLITIISLIYGLSILTNTKKNIYQQYFLFITANYILKNTNKITYPLLFVAKNNILVTVNR